jgi:hypothetical protein
MSASLIGRVISCKSRRSIEVKWDSYSKKVFVGYGGFTFVGKANSAGDAMNVAEAWLHNK